MTQKIEARKRAGWSQDRAAVTAGTSRAMVSLFEKLPDDAAQKVIPAPQFEALTRVWADFCLPAKRGPRQDGAS